MKYYQVKTSSTYTLEYQNDTEEIKIESSEIELKYAVIGNSTLNKKINIIGNNSIFRLNIITCSTKNDLSNINIEVSIKGNDNQIIVNAISFCGDLGQIKQIGSIKIESNSTGNSGHLNQECVFLKNSGKCELLPILMIHNNNVKASHGAKVHSFDKSKLNYLNSKGINLKECYELMINGYLNRYLGNDETNITKIFNYLNAE